MTKRDCGRVLRGKVVWKDRRDCNHGKRGWVGGNPRYRQRRAAYRRASAVPAGHDRSMRGS